MAQTRMHDTPLVDDSKTQCSVYDGQANGGRKQKSAKDVYVAQIVNSVSVLGMRICGFLGVPGHVNS